MSEVGWMVGVLVVACFIIAPASYYVYGKKFSQKKMEEDSSDLLSTAQEDPSMYTSLNDMLIDADLVGMGGFETGESSSATSSRSSGINASKMFSDILALKGKSVGINDGIKKPHDEDLELRLGEPLL
mmetsp:Transcript_25954/g.26379  ORF Transcript_25954/g.26379 Transcript_25954/m.26379 type:complete len:128 (-) Transcript_25954:507-890(-)